MRVGVRAGCRKVARAGPEKNDTTAVRRWRFIGRKVDFRPWTFRLWTLEKERMRIGFDARMITHPGIGRYISCLLPEMIRLSQKNEFVLFGDPDELKRYCVAENVKVLRWTAPIYSPWEQFFAFYSPLDIDIFHVPHFNMPFLLKKKTVVTIHDLIYQLFPDSVPSPVAGFYAEAAMRSAVRKADKIIAVSKNTRGDIIKKYGEDNADKIKVIYEAVGKEFNRVTDKTRIADVRCRYRVDERIILYVGSVKPHKNVETLMKVFKTLKDWGLPHQLVICGRWDKKEDRIKEDLLDKDIRYLGEVSGKDLVVLYSIADVLVHLSLYEGFGFTPLEAMQCGTPVVVSNSSSLPEVVGPAAFTGPLIVLHVISDTVYNVIMNQGIRERLIGAGLKRVKLFSWEKAAEETLAVYEETCHSGM